MALIGGKPLLWYVVSRAGRAKYLDEIVVATTDRPTDDVVVRFCAEHGWPSFRGSEQDVLDRYYQTAWIHKAEVVVRITADCPLVDPHIVDLVIEKLIQGPYDYASNTIEPTYPDGLDVEAFRFTALERAWSEAKTMPEREHVTPYLWRNPEKFRLANVAHPTNLSHLRWTVDEPEDLEFVRRVFAHLEPDLHFGMEEVLRLLQLHPELSSINAHLRRNEGYRKSLEKAIEDAYMSWRNNTGQQYYEQAKKRIPGGTQLLSKRPEMFLPGQWPAYYRQARGIEVVDLDGNRYLDMSHNGIGTCILGAADLDVDKAVKAAIDAGTMSTLNCPEEVELAELLCTLHPWADMVRYARTGGEAMAIAVRIARAHTGRDFIAFCGYHGWSDWYLAANLGDETTLDGHLLPGLEPAGVPRGLAGTARPFRYNHPEDLQEITRIDGDRMAAVVMEPLRSQEPESGFLEQVREIAHRCGAVLIFDEITAGMRLATGGAHLCYGTEPDIAVFAKAISNGYPMAAVIGRAEVMQAAQRTFISSTYWTERIGPAAALATIRKHREHKVHTHLIEMGKLVQDGWRRAAEQAGLSIHIGGIKPLSHFTFEGELAQEARTFFTQRMLELGFLAGSSFYATYAHRETHIARYLQSVEVVFSEIAEAIEQGQLKQKLRGPVAHSGFHRLT